jgi:Protein of unknown function (DUF3800)
VHLLYYDEVKYDPPNQQSYWLGGICVPHEIVPEIEEQINQIADEAFGSRVLARETEFHGIEICRGKGNFKGRDFDERLSYLRKLLAIIARDDILRLRVTINPENITHANDSPADIAFMFFVESADQLFQEISTLGMLFGDYDEPAIGSSVASLSSFRKGGTRWAHAKEIKNIIDTVHFAKSHHSRLIQLADIFLYCSQFCWGENTSNWRKDIAEIIKDSGILKCAKSKNWPQQAQWFR